MNYKEIDKLTVDMTGVVVSSLVSSTSSTVGTSKGSTSTSSCFGMTTSISRIGIDEIISHSQSMALTLCWPYILLFSLKFLLLLSPAFVFPILFLFLFEGGLSSLLQLSFLFLFFFFLLLLSLFLVFLFLLFAFYVQLQLFFLHPTLFFCILSNSILLFSSSS